MKKAKGEKNKKLLSKLEHCAAGTYNRAAANRPDLALALLFCVSGRTVDPSHEQIHHLASCLRACELLAGTPISGCTYRDIVQALLLNWDALGNWTWPYRVLCDICIMDLAQ